VVAAAPRRGEVFLVALDPTLGREIRKTRPCVVLSPDELNGHLSTVIVAPMTTGGHRYPFRIPCRFKKRPGFVVLDQLRTVDSTRLIAGSVAGDVRSLTHRRANALIVHPPYRLPPPLTALFKTLGDTLGSTPHLLSPASSVSSTRSKCSVRVRWIQLARQPIDRAAATRLASSGPSRWAVRRPREG